MSNVSLVEKFVIKSSTPTERRRIFLSNIDLALVSYHDSVSFFDPPTISFDETRSILARGVSDMLVAYDFLGGRIVPNEENRLEIDCNGSGVVFAAANIDCEMTHLGHLEAPNSEFGKLIAFLRDETEEVGTKLEDQPILLLQLTRFKCGSLAFSSRYNHCTMDGICVHDFEMNLASLTRGNGLHVVPNPDRTMFKARVPPKIDHPHLEFSKTVDAVSAFTTRGNVVHNELRSSSKPGLVYLSDSRIARLKEGVLKDGSVKRCSTFHAVAARIWKARSIAMGWSNGEMTKMLFPVDVRRWVMPKGHVGFSGNGVIPGYASASVSDINEREDSWVTKRICEGLERLDGEYVRSAIDWLEVNGGVPSCGENTFSVVAWWKLGLEEAVYAWGKAKCATTISVKPGLVLVLPGSKEVGGLCISQELPGDQMEVFRRVMMED